MSFAKQYQDHAFYDLIEEAEKQGIALGVDAERERIIELLENLKCGEYCSCWKGEHCDLFAEAIKVINGKETYLRKFKGGQK